MPMDPNKWYTCPLYSFKCKLYFSLNLYSGLVDLATKMITSSLCRLETRILVYQVLRMHVLPNYRFSQMMRRGQYMINMERQGSGVQDLVGQDLMGYCSPHYLSLIILCSWIYGRVGHSVCSSRSCKCHRIYELRVFQIFVIVVYIWLIKTLCWYIFVILQTNPFDIFESFFGGGMGGMGGMGSGFGSRQRSRAVQGDDLRWATVYNYIMLQASISCLCRLLAPASGAEESICTLLRDFRTIFFQAAPRFVNKPRMWWCQVNAIQRRERRDFWGANSLPSVHLGWQDIVAVGAGTTWH